VINSYINYLKIYLFFVGIFLALITVLNWTVDPYNEIGNNRIGLYCSCERQAKNKIVSFPHNAILIGSSKTNKVNPDDLCKYKFYNASFRGSTPEEMFFYLKKYAIKEKLVVIGLDFYMFNERQYPLANINKWSTHSFSIHEYLLSYNVFRDSLTSIGKWFLSVPTMIKENGQINTYYKDRENEVFNDFVYNKWIQGLKNDIYHDFVFSKARMDYLKRTKIMLESRNIKHIVFINPLNKDVYSVLQALDSFRIFVEWKNELKNIFRDLKDLSYGEYSAKELFYNNDPFHYKPDTGRTFINSLLGCEGVN
jgi:hypothetical protein|tara:strand:+ start:3094 stop:4020 length:927 start_codon:yes stop_codon:yes gene_type:complete